MGLALHTHRGRTSSSCNPPISYSLCNFIITLSGWTTLKALICAYICYLTFSAINAQVNVDIVAGYGRNGSFTFSNGTVVKECVENCFSLQPNILTWLQSLVLGSEKQKWWLLLCLVSEPGTRTTGFNTRANWQTWPCLQRNSWHWDGDYTISKDLQCFCYRFHPRSNHLLCNVKLRRNCT